MSESKKPQLGIYKLYDGAVVPKFATEGSACFDLTYVATPTNSEYSGFNGQNDKITRRPSPDGSFTIMPGERFLLPTGLIFDIPKGYSVRVHPRSGMSVKTGISLANCEGVIDSDYVEEIKLTVFNISTIKVVIPNNTRVAQAEMIKSLDYDFNVLDKTPLRKTTRAGGFGSTGA